MPSAASWVCATCTVSVPGWVMVLRKNRPATQVVIPICRALSTIFDCPRRRSYSRCARFARSGTRFPRRSRTRRSDSARKTPIVSEDRGAGPSRSRPKRSKSALLPTQKQDPRAIRLASLNQDLAKPSKYLHPSIGSRSGRLDADLFVVRRPLHIPLQRPIGRIARRLRRRPWNNLQVRHHHLRLQRRRPGLGGGEG